MPYIDVIHEGDAEGELAEMYAKFAEPDGSVDDVLKVHSLNPSSLRAHLALYVQALRERSPLSFAERELIGVVASVEAGCAYCLAHHKQNLRERLPDDRRAVAQEVADGDWSNLTEREAAMAAFGKKLAGEPGAMGPGDAEGLREAGLTDREILDVVQTVGYFAYGNRVALGLGAQIEPWKD